MKTPEHGPESGSMGLGQRLKAAHAAFREAAPAPDQFELVNQQAELAQQLAEETARQRQERIEGALGSITAYYATKDADEKPYSTEKYVSPLDAKKSEDPEEMPHATPFAIAAINRTPLVASSDPESLYPRTRRELRHKDRMYRAAMHLGTETAGLGVAETGVYLIGKRKNEIRDETGKVVRTELVDGVPGKSGLRDAETGSLDHVNPKLRKSIKRAERQYRRAAHHRQSTFEKIAYSANPSAKPEHGNAVSRKVKNAIKTAGSVLTKRHNPSS